MDKQELALRDTSIGTLIEKVVSSQQAILAKKQIEVSIRCESGTCLMEPDLIWSLLVNLIDNAQKALERGGKLGIVSEMTAEGCRIRVADNGRGIPRRLWRTSQRPFIAGTKCAPGRKMELGLGWHCAQNCGAASWHNHF